MPKGVASLKSNKTRAALPALVAFAAGLLLSGATASAAQVRLLETGSSLLYPLFNLWVQDYGKLHPNVQITTQSTGSGTGIAQSISGIAQIGASDAYLSNAQMKKNPGMLNIPVAISSQMVNYNVPGLNADHLKLSGPALAAIYSGKIRYWDDAQLRKLNPGVKLPHDAIVPVHRTDGSGDTFIFSQFLSFSTPSWANSVGYGTTISWPPVESGIGAVGNPGMVNASRTTHNSLAYIGVSFRNAINSAKLGEAMLENRAGNFVLANVTTVQAAVKATVAKTPADERLSLIFAPGAQSYPIINYEYVIVKKQQRSPEVARELKAFLNWAIAPQGGNASHFMKEVSFVALPHAIAELSRKQIAEIR